MAISTLVKLNGKADLAASQCKKQRLDFLPPVANRQLSPETLVGQQFGDYSQDVNAMLPEPHSREDVAGEAFWTRANINKYHQMVSERVIGLLFAAISGTIDVERLFSRMKRVDTDRANYRPEMLSRRAVLMVNKHVVRPLTSKPPDTTVDLTADVDGAEDGAGVGAVAGIE